MNNLQQLFFNEVMCFVDLENKVIYSANLKPLKGQKLKRHKQKYYMIKYKGKKSYKSFDWLINKAYEKRDQKTGFVL